MSDNSCILDGTRCIHCNKCYHISKVTNNKSSNWLTKFLIAVIITLLLLLLLVPIAFFGLNFAYDLLEGPSHNYYTSPTNYQNDEGPVPYYDSGFMVYTYQDNPATCSGGKCQESQFAYV